MAVNTIYKATLVAVAAAGLFFLATWLPDPSVDEQRTVFLRAEKMLEQGDDTAFLAVAESLKDYPLYPYLQYEWLKKHLQKTDKVTEFLAQYDKTRYAPLLRAKWLDHLAKHERWQEFVGAYQGTENLARECHYYWALHEIGEKQRALDEAKRLWLSGDNRPQTCDPLFAEFMRSPAFNQDLIWQRFELAIDQENWPLVEYIRRLLDEPGQKMADLWVQVHKKPLLVKDSGLWISNDALTGQIFAEGVARLAFLDTDTALQLWDGRKQYLTTDKQVIDKTDKKLALALYSRRDSRAYRRLQQVRAPDDKVREARIRAALLEQDWQHVSDALAALPWAQLQEPAWQYWRARMLAATGKSQEAQTLYLKLAEDRNFYGFLAADYLGNGYTMGDKPVTVTDGQRESVLGLPEFKAIQEWRLLKRDGEARRQWWTAVESLDQERLMVAAKVAQEWQWQQIAIMTLVKADYWDDLSLRFPLLYVPEVQSNAQQRGLPAALIFGLMRQESMLDSQALSPVGAKGLLQLMPDTAQEMAAKLAEVWHGEAQLFKPEVNIRYGSYYFAELLRRFHGQVAVAAAAYNAGPNRAAKWLPTSGALPADIWIETIPYKETRKYVTSVLSYTIIYQQRLQSDGLKLAAMLTDVAGN
ncbi:MAG: transglycosylase SLT domain-containing protein [Methylovulum sp.]|nr:transglycosylase SLT domain-containing protein [Methylovulum sp.]